jgi:photosystem II stability/assembly factor-like uncharacterized protein
MAEAATAFGDAAGVLVGTVDGLRRLDDGGEVALPGHRVTAMTRTDDGWLALLEGRSLWRGDGGTAWEEVAAVDGPAATCLVAVPGGALVGTAEAHLVRVDVEGRTEVVAGFEEAEGRDGWYTPWGGPPDTRSLAAAPDGTLFANVHVGGILRSTDGGQTWAPTIDVDTDVHQVLAPGGPVLAASAYGLAESADGGVTWDLVTDGLHATYSRAVARAGDDVLLSASTGPGGDRSAVYRREGGTGPLERCRAGLPEWLDGNVDTDWLAASGPDAAFATADGTVYASSDAGRTWDVVARGLPKVTCVALV